MLLVVGGGILFAIIRWKRHPKVSMVTVLALAIYFFTALFFIVALHNVSGLQETLHLSFQQISYLQTTLFVIDDIAYAVVLGLLVTAAFIKRNQPVAAESEG